MILMPKKRDDGELLRTMNVVHSYCNRSVVFSFQQDSFYSPRKSHIPNKRHEVVSFPIFTTTFSTSNLPIYGEDSRAE